MHFRQRRHEKSPATVDAHGTGRDGYGGGVANHVDAAAADDDSLILEHAFPVHRHDRDVLEDGRLLVPRGMGDEENGEGEDLGESGRAFHLLSRSCSNGRPNMTCTTVFPSQAACSHCSSGGFRPKVSP